MRNKDKISVRWSASSHISNISRDIFFNSIWTHCLNCALNWWLLQLVVAILGRDQGGRNACQVTKYPSLMAFFSRFYEVSITVDKHSLMNRVFTFSWIEKKNSAWVTDKNLVLSCDPVLTFSRSTIIIIIIVILQLNRIKWFWLRAHGFTEHQLTYTDTWAILLLTKLTHKKKMLAK